MNRMVRFLLQKEIKMGYYGKEKEPKGAKSSDSTGEKRESRLTGVNSTKFMKGASGEKAPKGADSSDTTGERKAKGFAGGVALGMEDTISGREAGHMGKHDGRLGEFNHGNVGEKVIYDHKRYDHDQDSM
jgi:hypothetical protein